MGFPNRCRNCNGSGRFSGMGMLERQCWVCNGRGFLFDGEENLDEDRSYENNPNFGKPFDEIVGEQYQVKEDSDYHRTYKPRLRHSEEATPLRADERKPDLDKPVIAPKPLEMKEETKKRGRPKKS